LPSIYLDDEITKQRELLEERRWKKDRINDHKRSIKESTITLQECSMKSESKHQRGLISGGIKHRPENFEEPQKDTYSLLFKSDNDNDSTYFSDASTSTHSSYSSKNKEQIGAKMPNDKNKQYIDFIKLQPLNNIEETIRSSSLGESPYQHRHADSPQMQLCPNKNFDFLSTYTQIMSVEQRVRV